MAAYRSFYRSFGLERCRGRGGTCAYRDARVQRRNRRQLLDIFAERSARTELLSAVSTTFAQLAGWDYADCPIPEGLTLVIGLGLEAASGRSSVGELAEQTAHAAGLDRRACASAILRLVWENALSPSRSDGPLS